MISHLDDLYHLTLLDGSITIDVVHRESPIQFVANFTRWSYVNGQKKLFEIYGTSAVCIKCAEHVLTETFSITIREEFRVNL